MSNRFALTLAALSLVSSTTLATAQQQFGTEQEARAMLDRAVAALKSDEAKALRDMSDANNTQFHDHDLYMSCFTITDGKFTAFPSPGMIGMDVRTFTMGDDAIGQKAFDAVKDAPEGTVVTFDYNAPKAGQPAVKQSLEARVGNQACGVSYYK
jgi:hypothetical protein